MKIWFNHWFSTAYHLIHLMCEGQRENFTIIGTNKNPLAVYMQACDEWYSEPEDISAEQYIDFCIEFCKAHSVDIFVPRRFLPEIIRHQSAFDAIGVRLFANTNTEMMDILDDKQKTYDFFTQKGADCIPETIVAHNMEEFRLAYEHLNNGKTRVCYKLVQDEGARSFRVIDDRIDTAAGLMERPGSKVTFAMARKIMEQYDFSNPVLLMPYLSGVEISVDCLKTDSGNIIIPRYKTNARYSEVRLSEAIMQQSETLYKMTGLDMPANIQFKKEGDKPYLLEINPRMSGGLQASCLATGINIPRIALGKLLGQFSEWHYPEIRFRKIANIETPICLE